MKRSVSEPGLRVQNHFLSFIFLQMNKGKETEIEQEKEDEFHASRSKRRGDFQV